MTTISVFDAVAPINEELRSLDWPDYMACAVVVCAAGRQAYARDEGEKFGILMDATISAIRERVVDGSPGDATLEGRWEAVSDEIRHASVPGLIALRASLYILTGELAADPPYSALEWLLMSVVNYNLDRPGFPKAARTENERAISVGGTEFRALGDVRRLIAEVRSVGRLQILKDSPPVRIG